MFPSTSSINKNQSLRHIQKNDQNLSFNRTYTLPRRFKERFFLNNTSNLLIKPNKQQKIEKTSSPSQLNSFNKSVDSLFKSFKYLEQILLKKKYEIISSISTAILECILDLYNHIKSIENTQELTLLKLNLNTNLANFIKWSDTILCFLNLKSFESNPEFDKLIQESNTYLNQLSKSVHELVEYFKNFEQKNLNKKFADECSKSNIINHKSQVASPTQSKKNISVNVSNDICTKTVETQIEANTVQISTLTRSNAKENLDLDTFLNLDKLAFELSELSSIDQTNSFTNDKCNYLLKQFESFAKEFSMKEKMMNESQNSPCKSTNSCYSTLNRSTYTTTTSPTCYSSPHRYLANNHKKKTFYKNTQFKHDLESKIELCKSLEQVETSLKQTQLNKSIDYKNRQKLSFIETNLIKNPNLSKLVLNRSQDNDINEEDCVSYVRNDSVNIQNDLKPELIQLNLTENIHENDSINPSFLLIDDDDSDNENEINDLNLYDNDVLIIIENENEKEDELEYQENDVNDKQSSNVNDVNKLKLDDCNNNNSNNLTSFSSESVSNSSLSLSNDKQDNSKINLTDSNTIESNTNLNKIELNKNISSLLNINTNIKSVQSSLNSLNLPSPVQTVLNKTEQNLQSESSLSGSSHLSNSSQLCSSLLSPNSNKNNETNVLSLLDVTHLLEYQSSSSISTSSLSNSNPVLPNSSILRGGDIDALIVLATSASSSVIAAPAVSLNNNSSHSLPSAHSNSPSTNSSSSLNFNQNNLNNNNNNKMGTNFLFQEAFLTTYRTILDPIDLIKKLICRYRLFSKLNSSRDENSNSTNQNFVINEDKIYDLEEFNSKFDLNRLKSNLKVNKMQASAVRNSLTLLVRVLDDLGNELDNKELVELLNSFIFELLIDDELQMARLLRKKLLVKLEKRRLDKQQNEKSLDLLNSKIDQIEKFNQIKPQITIPYINTFTKRTILDYKSIDIAEQMTLIDLNLFNRIELSEVLLWSTKQNEQLSPNLIKFTEHFNNISYWARSRILEPENYKDRERYLIKFLKIMKHLRKMNNFNSYLSILSAVDSGPIQRLDWPKFIIDTIKEFSALIDPKCGFKSLREAIAEAEPPCIPHIGLILQDLTILHIANPDYLPSGNCNFWKRWQQFNILERLRYFKRCNYTFKPNIKIQELFNNFKDYIGEDAQYTLSEQLKPRSKNGK